MALSTVSTCCVLTHLAMEITSIHFPFYATSLQFLIRNIQDHLTESPLYILFSRVWHGTYDSGTPPGLLLAIVWGVVPKCVVIKNKLAKMYSPLTTPAPRVNPTNNIAATTRLEELMGLPPKSVDVIMPTYVVTPQMAGIYSLTH